MWEGFIVSTATYDKASVLTGRQLVLLFVIGLHALLIAGLMTTKIVVDRPQEHVFRAVSVVDVPEIQLMPRPEVPVPDLARPQPVAVPRVPAPQIGRELQWVAPDEGLPPVEAWIGPSTVTEPAPAVPDTALSYRATRSPDDYYPPVSLRLQEQGSAVVRVCVAADGRLDGAPRIEQGSGSRYLDAAALKWASEALVFTPATRAGTAVPACKGFRVHFTLR